MFCGKIASVFSLFLLFCGNMVWIKKRVCHNDAFPQILDSQKIKTEIYVQAGNMLG